MSEHLEQLDLHVQVGGWNQVREINCHPNITCSVRSRDQAAVLADELPKGQKQPPTSAWVGDLCPPDAS